MTKLNIQTTLVALFLCFSTQLKAQTSLNYPYSISGVGLLEDDAFIHQRLQGGLNTALDSNGTFSFSNPASLSSVTLTDLEFGFRLERLDQQSATARNSFTTGSLDYVALGVPISTKRGIGFAFGLRPYSKIDYFIQQPSVEDSIDVLTSFEGSGGLNQMRFALGFRIKGGFSAGISSGIIFGNTSHSADKYYASTSDLFSFRRRSNEFYQGMSNTLGVQYSGRIGKHLRHVIGASYNLSSTLNVTGDEIVRTYNSAGNFFIDTVIKRTDPSRSLTLPTGFSAGYTIGNGTTWSLGLQYSKDQWSSFTDLSGKANFYDQDRVSIGGYFQIKSYGDFAAISGRRERTRNYAKVVRWYYGASTRNLYMNSFSEQVSEVGINIGLGLPIIRSTYVDEKKKISVISRVNIGAEYTKRGSTNNGLIQENTFRLYVGTNFNDKWFTKRKYQ